MKQLNQEQLNQEQLNPRRISFSELKNWKECSYRHKLIYIDKLDYFSGNEYTAFGTAIHEVCEKIIPGNTEDPYVIFKNSFIREIKSLNSEGLSLNKKLILDMVEEAKGLCYEILPAIKEHFKIFEVVSVEELLLEDMSDIESYGKKFKGFIDIVLKTPDGQYHIIDWKSCSWGWPQRKKTDPMTTYQLTYYKNYFSKKHNIDQKNIQTYFVLLKRTAKKQRVEICEVTSGPKKTTNALKVLENAVINIEKGNHIKNRLSCKYCKFYKTENCT